MRDACIWMIRRLPSTLARLIDHSDNERKDSAAVFRQLHGVPTFSAAPRLNKGWQTASEKDKESCSEKVIVMCYRSSVALLPAWSLPTPFAPLGSLAQ
jgi:hypothetical protein